MNIFSIFWAMLLIFGGALALATISVEGRVKFWLVVAAYTVGALQMALLKEIFK